MVDVTIGIATRVRTGVYTRWVVEPVLVALSYQVITGCSVVLLVFLKLVLKRFNWFISDPACGVRNGRFHYYLSVIILVLFYYYPCCGAIFFIAVGVICIHVRDMLTIHLITG